jgi:hypothetical protein
LQGLEFLAAGRISQDRGQFIRDRWPVALPADVDMSMLRLQPHFSRRGTRIKDMSYQRLAAFIRGPFSQCSEW